jgi:hypothetical protein
MRTVITLIKNDKLYDLTFTLKDATGTAVNLTNGTLKFKVQKAGAAALKFTGTMTVIDANAGTCKYQVQATDFDSTGRYDAEIEVTYSPSTEIITFSDIIIKVKDDLPK